MATAPDHVIGHHPGRCARRAAPTWPGSPAVAVARRQVVDGRWRWR
ncbi:MAG: hypothetical protein U0841_17865 [Chloroflexia bacterium]